MSTPFDRQSYDDWELPEFGPDTSADDIESANSYEIPPGEHTLMVHSIPYPPEEQDFHVKLGGKITKYTATRLTVRFCMVDAPNRTVDDRFIVPPANPSEMLAYMDGVPLDYQGEGRPLSQADKFAHFIARLGWPYPKGGKLPPEARALKNWKGRRVIAKVKAGQGSYVGNDGKTRDRKNQVALWSYKAVAGQGNGAVGQRQAAGSLASAADDL